MKDKNGPCSGQFLSFAMNLILNLSNISENIGVMLLKRGPSNVPQTRHKLCCCHGKNFATGSIFCSIDVLVFLS